ncbi:MAG: hypothetical protein U0271_31395 [Polyangiaceae bacterium]
MTANPPKTKQNLVAEIDGAPLPPDEARALWTEFSQHMEEHHGDFAGFAAAKGWASVKPEYRAGRAVLVATKKK